MRCCSHTDNFLRLNAQSKEMLSEHNLTCIKAVQYGTVRYAIHHLRADVIERCNVCCDSGYGWHPEEASYGYSAFN